MRKRQHFFINGFTTSEPYSSGGGGGSKLPPRSPAKHGKKLQKQLRQVQTSGEARRRKAGVTVEDAEPGLYVQFELATDKPLKDGSLEPYRDSSGIELVSVRPGKDDAGKDIQLAQVFVPDDQVGRFLKAFVEYETELTDKGKPKRAARWTPPIQKRIDRVRKSKAKVARLLRRYGFGVPDEGRALMSWSNRLTLVVQDEIQPFKRGSSGLKLCEMRLHRLPWPAVELARLGETDVRLRVVLSYHIEPNPGRRGWEHRHRYASHGLRFDVKTATESLEAFRKRVNKAARDEGEKSNPVQQQWLVGPKARHRGSLHCDIWEGSAADLAARDALVVYPVSGWWKDRKKHPRSLSKVRYSLVVSIETEKTDVDLLSEVEAAVQARTDMKIEQQLET